MASLTATGLANGQLPAAKGTLYTATGPTVVKSISLVNTSGGAVTVTLYYKKTTSRAISPISLSIAANAAYFDDTVRTMDAGDLLEGVASSATTVDYVISGATA